MSKDQKKDYNKISEVPQNGANDYQITYISLYNQWYIRLKNMLISSIVWENQSFYPEFSVPEKWLCTEGQVICFKDEVADRFCILPCIGSSSMNLAGVPSEYEAYGMDGYTRRGLRHGDNAVVILNNPMGTPENKVIRNFAYRLTEIQITQQVNLNANKTPTSLVVPEDLKLTAKNYYEKFTMGAPLIMGNSNLNQVQPKAILTGAPYMVGDLSQELRTVWAEWLTYCGTPGMDLQKAERLLQDEIAQAMGGAMACRAQRMNQRRLAADMVNKIFGLNLKPVFSVDVEPVPTFLQHDDSDPSPDAEFHQETEV